MNLAELAAVVPTRPKYLEPLPTTLAPLAIALEPTAASLAATAVPTPTSAATMPVVQRNAFCMLSQETRATK